MPNGRSSYIRIADRSELGWSVVAEYNAEELADHSEGETRLQNAAQSAEMKAAKRKKKCAEQAVVLRGARFVSNPATGSTASSGMQTGYQVPRRPGMIRCSSAL